MSPATASGARASSARQHRKQRGRRRGAEPAPAVPVTPLPAAVAGFLSRHGALAVFALALLARAVYLLELRGSPLFDVLLGDARRYDRWAQAIAAGDWRGREVFYQAPLYPYFLAILYRLGGHSAMLVRGIQALLGALSCALVCRAGERLVAPAAGLAAGILLALYPPAIFFDGLLQKAALDLLFTALLLVVLSAFAARPRAGLALAGGAVLGAFALNRENALVLLPLAALWLAGAFRPRPARERLGWIGLLCLGAALCLVPVALRNRAVGGELVLTTAQAGPNFYIGNHPGADGRYHPLRKGRGSPEFERQDAVELARAAAGRPLDARAVSRYWLARGLDFARRQPAAWTALLLRKWGLTWNAAELVDTDSLEAYRDRSTLLRLLYPLLGFGTLCPLAFLGVWVTRRRWRELLPLYVLALVWAGAVALFYVFARYRYPLVPVLAVFAGAGCAGLAEALASARRSPPAGGNRAVSPGWRALGPGLALAAAAAIACRWPIAGIDPRATTYADLGTTLADEGRLEPAAAELARAVALAPELAGAHLALGNVELRRGDADAALASYRRAADLDPADAQAESNLGTVLARQGRTGEAEASFRAAIARDPAYAGAYGNLAQILARRGDGPGAVALARREVELAPADPEGHHQLGNLLAFTGDAAAAEGEYRQAIALAAGAPAAADARYKLAVLLDRRGERAAAAELRAAAFRQAPQVARLHARQGLAAEQRGAWSEAAARYREVLAVLPDDRLALTLLARLLAAAPDAALRNAVQAAALAERAAAATGGRDPAALAALAAADAEAGRFREAADLATRAARTAPTADARHEYEAEGHLYLEGKPLRLGRGGGGGS